MRPVEPYYQEEGITIYHGDCREILAALPRFELLLTDPPYGMEFVSNYRLVKYDAIKNDHEFPLDLILFTMSRVYKAAYIFCRWNNLWDMPKPASVLVWVKNNWSMGDLQHEHGRQWEACCFYPKEEHAFRKRIPDVIYADRTGNEQHPTEKPVELLKTIILANACQTIVDPFMGSGSTLCAAKQLGHEVVGIEIEEKYCAIAVERLQQEVLPLEFLPSH